MIEYDSTIELVETDVATLLTEALCKGALEGMRVQSISEDADVFTVTLTKVEEV